LEEVAESLGVTKITIYEHLNHLVAKGAVHRDKARARAVAVLHDPDARPEPVAASPAEPVRELTIPVLGSIAAGRPIEAVEDKEELALTDLIPSDDRHY